MFKLVIYWNLIEEEKNPFIVLSQIPEDSIAKTHPSSPVLMAYDKVEKT